VSVPLAVDFDPLCNALEAMGWAAVQESSVQWKFYKQVEGGIFKAIEVHMDGTVRLSATQRSTPRPYRLTKPDWMVLHEVEKYVTEVL
jgi:hypothetical protein